MKLTTSILSILLCFFNLHSFSQDLVGEISYEMKSIENLPFPYYSENDGGFINYYTKKSKPNEFKVIDKFNSKMEKEWSLNVLEFLINDKLSPSFVALVPGKEYISVFSMNYKKEGKTTLRSISKSDINYQGNIVEKKLMYELTPEEKFAFKTSPNKKKLMFFNYEKPFFVSDYTDLKSESITNHHIINNKKFHCYIFDGETNLFIEHSFDLPNNNNALYGSHSFQLTNNGNILFSQSLKPYYGVENFYLYNSKSKQCLLLNKEDKVTEEYFKDKQYLTVFTNTIDSSDNSFFFNSLLKKYVNRVGTIDAVIDCQGILTYKLSTKSSLNYKMDSIPSNVKTFFENESSNEERRKGLYPLFFKKSYVTPGGGIIHITQREYIKYSITTNDNKPQIEKCESKECVVFSYDQDLNLQWTSVVRKNQEDRHYIDHSSFINDEYLYIVYHEGEHIYSQKISLKNGKVVEQKPLISNITSKNVLYNIRSNQLGKNAILLVIEEKDNYKFIRYNLK